MHHETPVYTPAIIGDMSQKTRFTRLKLTDEQYDQIERITRVFADEIHAMGTHPTSFRHDGTLGPNLHAAITLALAKLDEQARRIEEQSK